MMPTPTPAPPMPMQAMPAPIYFAATGSITQLLLEFSRFAVRTSMARVNRIVHVDASEDGEDVGLQERDQRLKREQDDDEQERQDAGDPADDAEPGAKQDDEAGEDLQRDVACQHVREQTYAVRDRPRDEGQDLDRDDQWQDIDRYALRHENIEEVKAVSVEAVNDHNEENGDRHRRGDDDVACHREGEGDEAEYVEAQHEHEQREHEGEESHAFVAGRRAHGRGDEFVGEFGGRLQPRRYEASLRRSEDQKRGQRDDCEQHECR